MRADGTYLRRLRANYDMAAVAALPNLNAGTLKNFAFVYVLKQRTVTVLCLLYTSIPTRSWIGCCMSATALPESGK